MAAEPTKFDGPATHPPQGVALHSHTPAVAFAEDQAEMASSELMVDLDARSVDFMEVPPDHVVCPSCRKVFRNPHTTSCCSAVYCRKCVESAESETLTCPSCGSSCEIVFSEKAQRSVNELYIRCVHVQAGCMWFGKLGHLPIHLDESNKTGSPSPTRTRKMSVSSCAFVLVACPYGCGLELNRVSLAEHTTKRCKERPYTCEHCNEYSSTFAEAEREHFPTCSMFPIRCPNKCPQKTIPRCRYKEHLASECPYQDNVECVFNFAGCSAKLRRKDVDSHVKNNLAQHLSLLAGAFLNNKAEVQEKLDSVATAPEPVMNGRGGEEGYEETLSAKDNEIQQLKSELQHARREKDEEVGLMREMLDTLKRSVEDQGRQLRVIETLNNNLVKEIARLKPFVSGPLPITFTVSKFEQIRKADKWWYSRPFYSAIGSYRLTMFVFCNGVLDGKGTHLSVFVYLVRGEYDDELVWPFRANVSVHLLNQRGDRNHYQKMIRFTPATPAAVCNRVTNGEMAKEGNGPTQFISLGDLEYNSSTDTQYLRDDCLKIRVNSVQLKSMNRGKAVSVDGLASKPVRSSLSSTSTTPPLSPTTPATLERRGSDVFTPVSDTTEKSGSPTGSPTTPKKTGSSPTTPKKTGSSPTTPKKTGSSPTTPKKTGSSPATPKKTGSSPTTPNGSPATPQKTPLHATGDSSSTETEPKPEEQTDTHSEPAAKPDTSEQTEAQPQSDATTQETQSQSETVTQPDAQTKPESQPQSDTQSDVNVKHDPKDASSPDIPPVATPSPPPSDNQRTESPSGSMSSSLSQSSSGHQNDDARSSPRIPIKQTSITVEL